MLEFDVVDLLSLLFDPTLTNFRFPILLNRVFVADENLAEGVLAFIEALVGTALKFSYSLGDKFCLETKLGLT